MPRLNMSDEERFWMFVNKDGPVPVHVPHLGNCWEWTGTKDAGYGRFWVPSVGGKVAAHRYAFGPTSLWVLHRCDNPLCVRKSHLFEGTVLDNNRDATAKGRHGQGSKTHCPHGHPYTEENTYRYFNRRRCKICNRAAVKRSHERRMAVAG